MNSQLRFTVQSNSTIIVIVNCCCFPFSKPTLNMHYYYYDHNLTATTTTTEATFTIYAMHAENFPIPPSLQFPTPTKYIHIPT